MLYQTNLDPKTTYELIQNHGRTDVYLHYATVISDFQRVIEHWIMEEEWIKALDVLVRQVVHFFVCIDVNSNIQTVEP